MNNKDKIYVAGHNGMVGSAICRNLTAKGFKNLIYTPFPPYDLTNQQIVADFFEKERPDYVFLAAAKVGGIISNNTHRAQFIYENMMIQNNIIHHSYLNGVKKLMFLGSSCIYPKNCPQPIKEEYLLTGELEYTNEPYAIAKIAGIKMCESYNIQYGTNYISVMPTNLYGLNDNYNLETSHVLPALIRKMHLGKCLMNNDWESIGRDLEKYPIEGITDSPTHENIIKKLHKYGICLSSRGVNEKQLSHNVTINLWGSGKPYREFLYVDDLSEACVYLMDKGEPQSNNVNSGDKIINTHINIGTGQDMTIKILAEIIKNIVGFTGTINWDITKPDGTFRKLLDVSKLKQMGWQYKTGLEDGIRYIYNSYKS